MLKSRKSIWLISQINLQLLEKVDDDGYVGINRAWKSTRDYVKDSAS
jgi:hypothetical protein